VRRRLVLAIAGVAATSVAVLALPLALVLQTSHRDEELLRLARDTAAATRRIDVATSPGADPVELPAAGATLTVYDRAGRRVAGPGPPAAPPIVRSVLRTGRPAQEAGDGQLVAIAPLYSGERVVAALHAERSDARAARDTRQAWLLLGLAALAIIAGAVAAALVLGRRLAAPLERLAVAARRLGDGDFSVRAPRSGVGEVDAVGAALDATAGRLDALVTRERAFTADASHQLRTPLQALRIELEAMELRGASAPEVPAALEQVDRLQTTIETLLAVARDASLPDARTDVGALVDGLAGRWTGPLAGDGRPLRLQPGGPPAPVAVASPGVVAEILEILMDNARRHGAGPVTVAARAVDGWIAVEVADEGPGLGDDPERAFLRRGPGVGAAGGAGEGGYGIGLVLARSLAHAEGGRLTARAGPGAVFTLMLRADGPAPPAPPG
jgi:signal transduction histidine kinase